MLDLLWTGDEQLEDWLLTRAHQVASVTPGCVGVTIALWGPHVGEGTFTFVATDDQLRVVDAAQYLSGGPCEQATDDQDILEAADLFSEPRWQLAALAGAANGVRSSLSFPIRSASSAIIGSVNVYGSQTDTFAGPAGDLPKLFGAAVGDAVSNADLSMSGIDRARQSTRSVKVQALVDIATGLLAEREHLDLTQARQRITDAAERAGVPIRALAELILKHQRGGSNH